MSIQLLSDDAIAQIKSSTTITSLNGVIIELLKNSLDAGSTAVEVFVDYTRGSCVVEDNGLGIAPDDLGVDGGLGKLYHTSKLGLDSQALVHGQRGAFLAALTAMALVTITSHHHEHRSSNTLKFHRSQVVSRQIPALAHQHLASSNHGTRVTVNDLFGNMPVRVKQRASINEKQGRTLKDWEQLSHEAVKVVLCWQDTITVTLRELGTKHKATIRAPPTLGTTGVVSISKICNVLSSASYIERLEQSSWVSVAASTRQISLSGAISLQPSATKMIQFLSFGIQPLKQVDGQGILHDVINRMFANSAFGIVDDVAGLDLVTHAGLAGNKTNNDGQFTIKELKGVRKGVDRWPKFVINISVLSSDPCEHNMCATIESTHKNGDQLRTIIDLLQSMCWEFLTRHHLRPTYRNRTGMDPDPKLSSHSRSDRTPQQRSGSADASQSERPCHTKSILKRSHSSLNPLGTKLKLPSFRQAEVSQRRPFDTWSRVKWGNVEMRCLSKHKTDFTVGTPDETHSPSTGLSSTVGETDQRPNTGILTPDSARQTKTAMSKNGKIVRRPFDDVEDQTQITQPLPTQKFVPEAVDHHHTRVESQDFQTWMNPITKVQSVIDQRTGLTVRSKSTPQRTSMTPVQRLSRNSVRESHIYTGDGQSAWVSQILESWSNPVFAPAEQKIPVQTFEDTYLPTHESSHAHKHECAQVNIEQALKTEAGELTSQISKDALLHSEVIAQVDRKYILVKVPSMTSRTAPDRNVSKRYILLLIDQHAADERTRIESLLETLYPPVTNADAIPTPTAAPTFGIDLTLEIPMRDLQLFITYKQHFSNWGILYDTLIRRSTQSTKAHTHHLVIRSLPSSIVERCRSDPRLLTELMRTEAWKLHEKGIIPKPKVGTWLERIQDCPQGLIDMLNSRACRSAIMFNDELTIEQCEALVAQLAKCKFPFQCAHGRPSLLPLVRLGGLGDARDETQRVSFGKAFRKWKEA